MSVQPLDRTSATPTYDGHDVDLAAVTAAVKANTTRTTAGIADMESYLAQQVADDFHRDVTGPLLSGSGASGVVVHRGHVIAHWGDPGTPEMLFSATKTFVSAVAGVAFDRGLLDVHAPVAESVDLPEFASGTARTITWEHLLHQTSGWQGELWGKPTWADAQSRPREEATYRDAAMAAPPPGAAFVYNDVRVNLLCLALTARLRRPLPAVLAESILNPLGASRSWSWHGYTNSFVTVDGTELPVVSGGAHWGGGLWMSAVDLARLGQLYLQGGRWADQQLLSEEWLTRSWLACDVKPDYGYLWWLNDCHTVWPRAPHTGRCARGNGGKHLLWIDPARELVIASHWTDDVETLIASLSSLLPATGRGWLLEDTCRRRRTATARPALGPRD